MTPIRYYINLVEAMNEAMDPNFLKFMNTAMSDRVDAPPEKDTDAPEFYQNATVLGMDFSGYRAAMKFGIKTIRSLDSSKRMILADQGEYAVVKWLVDQARRLGLLVPETADADEVDEMLENGMFMQEDIDEVQGYLPDYFNDPSIDSWVALLDTD